VQIDKVITANCTPRMIQKAQTIAEEVLRLKLHKDLDEKGACVSRERWQEHRIVPDMVRDSGLAYRDTDNNGLEVILPGVFEVPWW